MKTNNPKLTFGVFLVTTTLAGPVFAEGSPFREIDSNGDGVLTKLELSEVFGASAAERSLAQLDTDNDGVVSLDEATNAMEASEAAQDADEEIDLDAADANGDGDLSKEELTNRFGQDVADEVLEYLDHDGDGTVTEEEFFADFDGTEDFDDDADVIDPYELDLDGDGNITKAELKDIFGDEDAAEVLRDLDSDGNGAISTAELDELFEELMEDAEGSFDYDPEEDHDYDEAEVIDLDGADADGDGTLSSSELTDHFGSELAKEILGDLDVDSDGSVTDADFDAIEDAWEDDDWGDDEWDEESWEDDDPAVDYEDTEMTDDVMVDG